MEKYLPFVTIDLWTLIFTWVNLIILFLLMKKFFFLRMENVLKKRDDEIEDLYSDANDAKTVASGLKSEYEKKLSHAKQEALEIHEQAKHTAELETGEILSDAKKKASQMITKAQEQIQLEKKNSFDSLKNEISDISFMIAEKLLERSITDADHKRIVGKIIDELGE